MDRFFFLEKKEGRADAVPTTRNYTPDSPDLDERRGQPLRSAMARSRPGGTALLITVIPQRQVSLMIMQLKGRSTSTTPSLRKFIFQHGFLKSFKTKDSHFHIRRKPRIKLDTAMVTLVEWKGE